MTKGRMEAFSDGVFAVIITIMVLEMKSPQGTGLAALQPLLPVFFSYVLSFVYVGIYWNNHHHLLQAAKHVTGGILWANLHLLFWLSLTPFVTAWMGENHFATWPVALYGVVLLFAGTAYFLLTKTLIAHHGKDSTLAASIGNDGRARSPSWSTQRQFPCRSYGRGSPSPATLWSPSCGCSLTRASKKQWGSKRRTPALRRSVKCTPTLVGFFGTNSGRYWAVPPLECC